MAWIALATAALAVHPVTSEFGGVRHINNSARYNRNDFVLTNTSQEKQQVAVCPQRIEVELHTARVEREPAFAVSFDDGQWTRDCTTHWLAPGEKARMQAYFREWWHFESVRQSMYKRVTAETSAGTFGVDFTRSAWPANTVVEAWSAYPRQATR